MNYVTQRDMMRTTVKKLLIAFWLIFAGTALAAEVWDLPGPQPFNPNALGNPNVGGNPYTFNDANPPYGTGGNPSSVRQFSPPRIGDSPSTLLRQTGRHR